ncbi:hypothetical protein [Moorena sp. SIO4G3]|uniref:hypothetical protein n=1 Tax=Moorena sp. SIO4G3 TaxID=2607821 RepID=UPI001428E5D5|nr:hypothetical protein [Moorena sp. SIO4G3]NEO81150.1 hypothetical protein [Moorena sp. SIO4G3]
MFTKIPTRVLRSLCIALGFILSFSMLNVQSASAVDLRVLTWNSTGESANNATELRNEINYLNGRYPRDPVKAIFNQEAKKLSGGDIYNMLNNTGAGGIGLNYTRPPRHITELINGTGRGYNALAHNTVTITQPLTHQNYTTDPIFHTWQKTLNPSQSNTVNDEVKNFRPPVYMEFNYSGRNVRLITWHAPIGQSGILKGCTTQGLAPLDAFLFLEQSSLINNTTGIDIIIIAGDLNMTSKDLKTKCQGYEPLKKFDGESSNLDHILAWRPSGGTVNYLEPRSTSSPSSDDHNIFSSRVNW